MLDVRQVDAEAPDTSQVLGTGPIVAGVAAFVLVHVLMAVGAVRWYRHRANRRPVNFAGPANLLVL